jgi:hypothetical protein
MADLPPTSSPVSIPSALPPSANRPTTVTNALNGGFNGTFSFNITEPRPEGESCGVGFLCDEDRMASCRSIQNLAIAYGFGDVHAGMTCPENTTTYQNCPVGSYCPSPVRTCCIVYCLIPNALVLCLLYVTVSLLSFLTSLYLGWNRRRFCRVPKECFVPTR